MKCNLVLSASKVSALKGEFGDSQIKVLEACPDGYFCVEFEVDSDYDVLKVLHAGTRAGLDLGLYGPNSKKEYSITVG